MALKSVRQASHLAWCLLQGKRQLTRATQTCFATTALAPKAHLSSYAVWPTWLKPAPTPAVAPLRP